MVGRAATKLVEKGLGYLAKKATGPGKKVVAFDARVRESGVGRGKYSPEFRGSRKATEDQINKRNAITAHLKPIHDKAPKQDGKAILPKHWKSKELKAIVEKHPDLFPDGLTSHKMHEILIGSKDRGKGRVGYVDWIYDTITKKPEKTLQKQMSELVGEEPGGIMSMVGRSLPENEFPTIERVDEFFTSQGINPKNILVDRQFAADSLTRENLQNFIKTDPSIQKKLRSDPYNYTIKKDGSHEFLPITLHRSHPDRSLNPMDPSFNFQGIDTKDIKILGGTVNTKVQPDLERALATYIKNKDVKNSKRINNKLKEYFIATKLNDPNPGFPKLNDDDYQWLINNKIVSADFPDEIVFGTLKKPNHVQIIEGELKARKEHLIPKRVYKQEYGEKDHKFYKTLEQGGMINGYAGGGLINSFATGGLASLLGKKLLKKIAGKLSEKELKMLMGSLWKGVDPRRSPRYKVWDKKRWGPGYKWPYQKSRIKGPEIKKSHFANLSPGERVELQSKHADELWEYQMKKKLGRDMHEDLEYPFLSPENEAFISTAPRTGLGRYQLQHYVDPENVGPIDKYKVYDWWDDVLNKMRKKPKFKYVKDAKGNIVLRKIK